jgi:hypothetical protein
MSLIKMTAEKIFSSAGIFRNSFKFKIIFLKNKDDICYFRSGQGCAGDANACSGEYTHHE